MKKNFNDVNFKNIQISGILNPGLIVQGIWTNKKYSLIFKSKNKVLYSYSLSMDEHDFYYFVSLTNQDKIVEIYKDQTLLLKIKNKFYKRVLSKMKGKMFLYGKNIKTNIKNIGYNLKEIWIEYHFLVPPKEWKKIILNLNKKLNTNPDTFDPNNIREYNEWIHKNEIVEKPNSFKYNPLISILIPVYNVSKRYLSECISSILAQTYSNFEICIVDDCSTREETLDALNEFDKIDKRIKIYYRKENGHISNATNDALKMAKGEFIGLVDNDDVLASNALYEIVKTLNENKQLDFIYTDEDKLNEKGERCFPHFKPDFSPDTLLGNNYICHFSVLRKSLVEKVGGFQVGLEGAQDHDLFLKIAEQTKNIYHIPKILYHWRMAMGSTAFNMGTKTYATDNGIKSIENALKRRNLNANIINEGDGYYIVNYKLKINPLISIIIPTKDFSETLDTCLKSIYEKTTYSNFEIIVIDNNSVEEKTFTLFEEYKKKYKNFKIVEAKMEFNYSKINNLAVKEAKGEYIVLLNNDTEVITPNWLELMVGYASLPHIGAVGAKLLYPDQTIQHAGVVLGIGGTAKHTFLNYKCNESGLYNRLKIPYNYSAVTAACLMVKKTKFEEVNGLEEKLKVAFNDIDFNLKLLKKGYYNICLPQVELFHFESKSRGLDTTLEKQARFLEEHNYMATHWKDLLLNDPMYNKNFSLKDDFMLDKK